jgi:crotonobetaine/carnitine-CoA ligase
MPSRTISAFFRRAVDDAPTATWLVSDDVTLTYEAAQERVLRAASALRSLGVARGDRVLVTPRTTPDYLLSWLALMEAGAIQVPLNPQLSEPELAGFVTQVDPKLIVSDPGLEGVVDGALALVGCHTARADVASLFDAPNDGLGPAAVEPDDVAVMIPTSGTTGRSKLVMQTHLAYVMAGEGFPWWLDLTSDDRLMTALPLSHLNAPAYTTLGSVAARASMVLLSSFSASTFLDSARRHGATQFNSIGAMLEILMRQPARDDDADNPIRLCYTGPSPDEARQKEIEARFGFEIRCGYALSETPYALIWQRGTRPYGTLGSPRQHPELGHVNDARLRPADDGADGDVAAGEVGELELRNPTIMRGYYEMPDETAAVIVDGWLRTGDLVRENDDGTYTFVGRKKEVIRRRGEILSPAEVEAALERHPDVAEAAVIGVASGMSEEEVKAFIVAADGGIDIGAVRAFAAEQLTRFKVPRYFEVVDELPHTATGRIAKHQLPSDRTPHEVDMGAAARRG